MAKAHPQHSNRDTLSEQERRLASVLRDEDHGDDEYPDDVTSLLEENARLRGLVVTLTELVLKTVAERR
jgi:hypothetical protein